MISIKSKKILAPQGFFDGYLNLDGDRIHSLTTSAPQGAQVTDLGNLTVTAGFIDMHTHGGAGHDFSGSEEDVLLAVKFHLSHGTTSICPTVSAAPIGVMRGALASISAARHSGKAEANILGAHLEGPYLSAKQCGAQSPDFIKAPDPSEYIPLTAEFGGDIARWTYAPENDPDGKFADFLAAHGIVASAGHTDAIGDEMNTAADHGCRLITHLYSCTSTVTRDHCFRRLGVIETAFLRDDIDVEIIADGKHLPKDLIRLVLKVKGVDRVALVTDSLHLAGTDVKTGRMMATDFIIEDGVCKMLDRSSFCGSIATTDWLVRTLTDEVGAPLADAVRMVTEVPARIMGANKGKLAPGFDADVVAFEEGVRVTHAWVMGRQAF